jgi:tRNA threonylcarbamoyl adenosine modification protein YeaZ
MAVCLGLVTCAPQLEVALYAQDMAGLSLVRLAGRSPRSRLLLAAVDLVFEDAGLEPSALEIVAVTRGPGSFTGIRSGLAAASGLAVALGADLVAYDSLTVQAARCRVDGRVWAAQPGRRGEAYVQRFAIAPGEQPRAESEIEVIALRDAVHRYPWVAPGSLDLAGAMRAPSQRNAAEALLDLVLLGVPGQPIEPLYVEGPPIHGVTS